MSRRVVDVVVDVDVDLLVVIFTSYPISDTFSYACELQNAELQNAKHIISVTFL